MGRARIVLVSGDRPESPAMLSWVVAQAPANTRSRRLRFAGPGTLDKAAAHHIQAVIVPLVDQIAGGLGLPCANHELSVANVNAAAASDLGIEICGYSADIPIFLAMLSAATGIALPDHVVATGHIASTGGDIAAVKALPQKLGAAMADPSVRLFIHPKLDRDSSMAALSPAEMAAASQAIAAAYDRLRMIAIADIGGLAEAVLSDESIVLASLRLGFFAGQSKSGMDAVSRTIRLLADGNTRRFWNVLQRQLMAGQVAPAVELLAARAEFQIGRREYPSGFGLELLQLLRSLPPAVRRLKVKFPLIPMSKCLELANLATESDHPDVQFLLDAASGRTGGGAARQESVPSATSDSDPQRAALDAVVSQINAEALAERISRPIDTARACYSLESVIADGGEQFINVVTAFYLHLLRHRNPVVASANPDAVRADALALLERTFERSGGYRAAFAEARDGVAGGLRFVLDAMTNQLTREEQAKEVNRVLKDALDPMDWQARVQFMASLMNRLANHLPPDLCHRPASEFAHNHEMLVRTYVQSIDQVKQAFRRL